MLFIHAGEATARVEFEQGAAVDWSPALSVVLEKYGLLSLDVVTAEDFLSGSPTVDASCVLVASVPAQWPRLVEKLTTLDAPVLFGEPPPASIRPLLGIGDAVPAEAAGTVVVVDDALHARAAGYGFPPGGRVGSGRVREVARDPAMDWQQLPAVPLDPRQVEAWRAIETPAERWVVGSGTDVLADWIPDGGGPSRSPAIVRRGSLRACAFGLFSVLARAHTSEPWLSGEFRTSPRVTGLEMLLLGLIDEMHAEARRPRARVLPWPRGASWALNIRHDFDRKLPPAAVQEVLDRHARAGTHATWYWRARRVRPAAARLPRWAAGAGNEALRLVADAPHHEVAHHTERLWAGADKEQRSLERVAGAAMAGTSAHGDPTCFRFQGAPNILWAEERGLRYTELIQQAHFHPHRFAALHPDGTVRPTRVLCLPHHESFDLSMVEGDTGDRQVLLAAERHRLLGGLMQVMNHPDINGNALFAFLKSLPKAGRYNCTAVEASDWWLRTHVAGEITLRVEGERVEVSSRSGVENLVVELLMPTGDRRLYLARLAPGQTTWLEPDHVPVVD